jgi:hypothetical protein
MTEAVRDEETSRCHVMTVQGEVFIETAWAQLKGLHSQ